MNSSAEQPKTRRQRRARHQPIPTATVPLGDGPFHTSAVLRRHWWRRLGVGVAVLAAFLGSGTATAYYELQGNIKVRDIRELLVNDSETKREYPSDLSAGHSLNLLVLGSDSRDGANDVDGSGAAHKQFGARSDTTMLVHVSADRSHIDIVSIPRDTLVHRPTCTLANGRKVPAADNVMFNSAFSVGAADGDVAVGAACSIRTVEHLTGLQIDDYVVVDFSGMMNMVNALGGVPMYVPFDVDDPNAQLKLKKGCHVFNGQEALAWARARKTLGDGSDISRIGRQQQMVAAIAREALNANILTDLPSLYGFISAVTKSLHTGPLLGSLTNLAGLAGSVRHIKLEDINMMTMPWQYAGPRVTPDPQAELVWADLKADRPLDSSLTATGKPPAATGASLETGPAALERAQAELAQQQTPSPSAAAPDTNPPAADKNAKTPAANPNGQKSPQGLNSPNGKAGTDPVPICTK